MVKSRAEEYRVDADRLGLIRESAGGQRVYSLDRNARVTTTLQD